LTNALYYTAWAVQRDRCHRKSGGIGSAMSPVAAYKFKTTVHALTADYL